MGSTIPCRRCGRLFIPWRAGCITCSVPCRMEYRRMKERLRGRTRPHRWDRPCRLCGQSFTSSNFYGGFCSKDCRTIGRGGPTSCRILKPCRDCGAAIPLGKRRLCGPCGEQSLRRSGHAHIGATTLPCFFCKDPVSLAQAINPSSVRCPTCQAIRDSRHLMDLLPPEGDLPIEYVRTVQEYRRAHKEIQNAYQGTRRKD